MANIDNILKDAGTQIAELGEKLFKQFTKQAVADGKAFLNEARDDLERWVDELERNEIDKSDFESLVRGQKDLAQMKALKQAGLAQVSIDTFTNGVLDIVINAAFTAIKL
jgi:hypothetical protein